jgi:hypothetical protein
MKKKQSHKTTSILVIILSLAVIVALLYGNSQRGFLTGRAIDINTGGNENQEPQNDVEEYSETPYTTQRCTTEGLTYFVTEEKVTSAVCNKQGKKCEGTKCTQFCADKTVSYSVDVSNLDEKQGLWKVEFQFYKEGLPYKNVPITQMIEAKTTKTFNGMIMVTSKTPAGNANQNFSANYSLISIPTKKVCVNVTEYK